MLGSCFDRFHACSKAAVLLLTFWMLSGCTASKRDPLSARRRSYEKLLTFIEPGMTRRQLYALVPPRKTPTATPPSLSTVIGVAMFSPHTEQHELDHDFSLRVQYRLARISEYPMRSFPQNIRTISGASASVSGVFPDCSRPSRENPDDELIRRPTLMGPGIRTMTIHFENMAYSDLTARKR